jgi:hypothetical protein
LISDVWHSAVKGDVYDVAMLHGAKILAKSNFCVPQVEKKALPLGDYSITGLEEHCVVERKDLADLVLSLTANRSVFVERMKRMSHYPHRLLVITAALSEVKSPYPHTATNPNRIFQSLIALLAGSNVPFLCAETHDLGEEAVASYHYQVHLYHWLETNGFGRFLTDDDL